VQCSKIIHSVESGNLSSFRPNLPAKSTPDEHFVATTLATVAGEPSGSGAVGLRDSRRRFHRRATRLPLDLHLPAWIRTPSCAAWEPFFLHFAATGVFATARAIQYYTSQQIRWVFGTLATDMEP
jgi:hypothetical protein